MLERVIYENLACLPDILHEAGYYQVFMGGANKSFAGKGNFLEQHGYDEVWGWEDWQKEKKYLENHNWWGLYDKQLFYEAIIKTRKLLTKVPFNLTLLTLNTHLPGFFSHSCPGYSYSEGNELLDAIYCTDAALGKYLDWLEQNGLFENSIIFITADHQSFSHMNAKKILGVHKKDNRIFALLHSPGNNLPSLIEKETTPYDLASNIPALVGIHHNIEFTLGESFLIQEVNDRFILDRENTVNAGDCDIASFALDWTSYDTPCQQKRLFALMDQHLNKFNRAEKSILKMLQKVEMKSVSNSDALPAVNLNGLEQLDHVVSEGIRQKLGEPGLYCVVLSPKGKTKACRLFNNNNRYHMSGLIEFLFKKIQVGDWMFIVHKNKAFANIPKSALYLLQALGCKIDSDGLSERNFLYVVRKGAGKDHGISCFNENQNELKVCFSLRDFKDLIKNKPSLACWKRDFDTDKFLTLLLNDEALIGKCIVDGIHIGDSSEEKSYVSYFFKKQYLQKGINMLIFSGDMNNLMFFKNYDFNENSADQKELIEMLAAISPDFNFLVVIALPGEHGTLIPITVTKAFDDAGFKLFKKSKYNLPYLLVFHTRLGKMIEMIGMPGSAIDYDSLNIVRWLIKKERLVYRKH